ncbi:two-partner secretion domain-containing protein [Pseudomonas viridiflava]|uniref:two-partner secretion domain-containing protein n=1 Tax=Pseudomonas viridiflava TaxID=33069 RepID=UPI001C31C5C6|nr:DNA/RNA non-specific endonuclease [Pseudomonas viridiflava]QXG45367.1 DNA/RNA non-specific endonuclease [Pseudomonas viridiflava]
MDVHQFALLARQPSAALTERQHFWGMPKRGLALILANALFWQPLLVQAEGIAVSGTGTTLGQAGNGVPIINIATPNASGLSHNQFQQYNVDSQGVILNNSTNQTQSTQLGGIIVGNSNLRGTAANTILNEVVGANASQLRGYTEVAGQAARVIVANPYGISCNGCGFINTPQVTLTTGKPILDANGQLQRFNVQGGSISIDGVGLNADNVDQFDIITRSAKINAELHAKRLNVITGRNDVDAQTLNPTALADDGSSKPELAIDSSALGGMYAGAIRLVGTEAGVGVRLAGDLAASGGDIQIDANGHLNVMQVAASGAVNVRANTAEVNGPVYAGSSLAMTTGGDLTTRQNVAARDALTLSAGGQLRNSAVIEAGVNADNSRNASGDVTLSANSLTNSGSITASRALQATVTQTLNNQGATLNGQASAWVAAGVIDNRQSGRILSQGGNADINASQVLNAQSGLISSSGNLKITAQTLDNSQQGKLSSGAVLTARISGQVLNQLGIINSAGGLLLNTGTVDNRTGEISSLGNLTATLVQFDNSSSGRLLANGTLQLTADTLNNQNAGSVSGQQNVQLTLGQLTNTGKGSVYARNNLGVNATRAVNNDQGVLRSDGTLNLSAASLASSGGSVTSAGTASITTTAAVVNQGGQILSDASLTLTSGSLDNSQSGRIAANGVTVTTGAFDNHKDGRLTSTGTLGLTAAQVNNTEAGLIASAMALTAVVTGLDQTNDGRLYSNSDVSLDLRNGLLINDGGLINAPGQLLLKNLNAVSNRNGEVSSRRGFTLAAKSLDNSSGSVISDSALIVRVDELLTNIRGLVSGNGIDVSAGNLNNASGSVNSDAALDLLVAGQLLNQKGELSSAGSSTLTANSLDNTEGQVMADKRLSVTIADAINNQGGTLGAGQNVEIRGVSLDNRQSGTVVTDGQLDLVLSGALDNRIGNLQAKGLINLESLSLDNRGGKLSSQNLLTVRSGNVDNRGGTIRAEKTMQLLIDQLDNSQQGLVNARAGLEFTGTKLSNHNGLFNSVGPMQLQAVIVLNDAGRIASQDDLNARIENLTQQGGELVAQGELALTGSVLNNHAGSLVGATKALKLDVGIINNHGSEISSQIGVELNGQTLDNSDGGKILAGTALGLNVLSVINRTKGMLFGNTLSLDGESLDNTSGTLASDKDLSITLKGALDNSAGLLSSEAAMTIAAASIQNAGGSLSGADALSITTTGAVLNRKGSISTDASLVLDSGSLDNSQGGQLSGKGATRVTTGAFDNSQGGRLTSNNTLELIASQVINRDAGRIASALALTVNVTALDQRAGELFSNTSLTLDMNKGQLNNSGGLINAPGALLLKNLADVVNQGGEISSSQAFTLDAISLDNSGGKLLSSQVLTLIMDQALINLKGTIAAAALSVKSNSLDNSEGLISSRERMDITVDAALTNTQGTVIADADLDLKAGSANNADGQISSKKNLIAEIGSLQQLNGQLFAQGRLKLTGESLDNRQNGLISATQALDIDVQNIDNRGGELSSQDVIKLVGHQLDNSDKGRILAQKTLNSSIAQIVNRNEGLLSGKSGLTLVGTALDNSGGSIVGLQGVTIDLSDVLANRKGLISSEAATRLGFGRLGNDLGSVSSAGNLTLISNGAISNQGGRLVTDGALDLRGASLDNSQQGSISSKGLLTLVTGNFNNSDKGRVSSADQLSLNATNLTNRGGSIGSNLALQATVTRLDQQTGSLFSNTALILDVNGGLLNNQGGLINSPGALLLKNLGVVQNQNGEISSAQAFTVKGQSLDNSGGKLLSNQMLTLRIAQALNNVKGMIAAAGIDATANTVDNTGGTLTSRNNLDLTVTGLLANRDKGLISATQTLGLVSANLENQGGQLLGGVLTVNTGALNSSVNGVINSGSTLNVIADSLDASGGEVFAKSDITLVLHALSLNAGRLSSEAGLSLNLNGADLENRNGFITVKGPLTLTQVRDLNNQGGEISSDQSYTLTGRTLDNSNGRLISSNALTLDGATITNQSGLISGWNGLNVSGTSLDNSRKGTLSSRSGDVGVSLSGALLNSGAGALVSQNGLTVKAASLDNQGGILSSGTSQTLTITGLLNNSQNGLIDSGATLNINTGILSNAAGVVSAKQAMGVISGSLDNSSGSLSSNGAVTLDLLGTLTNTNGKMTSGDALLLHRSTWLSNQGGQLVSQSLMTLNTAGNLDNSKRGTVAASGRLLITANGAVLNNADGLIYSKNADVQINAANLANSRGTVQSQTGLTVSVVDEVDNQSGRIIAQDGDLGITAVSLDSRGGVLASQQGALTTSVTGVVKNGYDLNNNRQGGVIQAQRLNLTALGGFDNYGGRISARAGDALIRTGNFDNRNGALFAKGLVRVTGHDFDNSGDNDGQIAGGQIDLNLTGALNNRLGIIESDSTLGVRAASLDNQTGQLRALGAAGVTQFNIGATFDNRNGVLESANHDLNFIVGEFRNTGGSLLHVGAGDFGISTANVANAGGSIVTRGGLTLNADSWTNDSVIQAGRLTVNVTNFSQTANGQLLAYNRFTGTGSNWTNNGLIASDGDLSLNIGGIYSGDGRMSSLGAMTVGAAQMSLNNVASIAGGGATGINVGGQLTNFGRLTSATDLTVNAGSISNYGALAASQDLTLTGQTVLNDRAADGSRGFMFSGRNMKLQIGTLTNRYADIYSLGNLLVSGTAPGSSAQSVTNSSGSIEAGGDIGVLADSFVNQRDSFSMEQKVTGGYMTIHCGQHCDGPSTPWVRGAIFIYQTVESVVSGDSSAATLVAGHDMTVNSRSFLNEYSLISASNDLSITSGDITNKAATSASGTFGHQVGDSVKIPGSIFYKLINDVRVYDQKYPRPGAFDPAAFQALVAKFNPDLFTGINDPIAVEGDGQSSAPAVIQAGGNVRLNASNDISNIVVQKTTTAVSARSGTTSVFSVTRPSVVLLNAQLPPGLAQQQVNPLNLPGFSLPSGQNGLFRLSGQSGTASQTVPVNAGPQSWTMSGASISVAQREQTAPLVQARDVQIGSVTEVSAAVRQLADITRKGAGASANASVFDASLPADTGVGIFPIAGHQSDATGVTVVSNVTGIQFGATSVGSVATMGPTSAGLTSARATVSPAASAARQTIARVQGLPQSTFVSKPQKYLIETNPVLTELKQFMSSDYLLAGLGYDPEASAKRLGDGLYEQRLVQQAVLARTGQAFIDGQTSNQDQFKYLMNNAIVSKEQLNLAVGVSLSSQQVAALTHDIVWLEEHEVNGEKVLVPVLYLAQADHRLGPTGALIAGNDVSLIAGQNLENVGTLRATNNLSATAANDLVNSGLIEAGNRLDLLAGNDIINKAGGIIAGRDVSIRSIGGDVINERTVTTHQDAAGESHWRKDFADSAARIEAANDMSVSAGRDLNNVGGTLQSGRDMVLQAGRDVTIASAEVNNVHYLNAKHNNSETTQLSASVSAGRDLSAEAGRDLSVIASQIDAKRDVAMSATQNLTLSSATDEEHSVDKNDEFTRQEDHVSQVKSELNAGGSVALSAGKDLAVISSRITAGKEAYLVAGDRLDILAAQDSDYSLYDMKKKGGFGASKTQRDEVTDVKNIGSEITAGGNLVLASGGDQKYQVAKLESGKDLTIQSGGSVTFEGVKDLHQESHEKSKGDLAWNSMSGKGNTDETLRQSELVAKGELAIRAVDGLKIDIKQIDQQSVSQTIDAMVKADPQLAWLKEADKRGDVDWRQVREIHESFKYSNSGLGVGAQMAIAIFMAAFVGPAVMGAMAGMGSVAASVGSVVATSAATNATVSVVNNRGNLGKVAQDVTSSSAMKGYVISGVTAGLTTAYFNEWTGTLTNSNTNKITTAPLNSWENVGRFGANQLLQNGTSTVLSKALGQGGSGKDALNTAFFNTLAAYSFSAVGDYSFGKYDDGSPQKVFAHALVGGLLAEASGGDFRTGAIAAGANELVVDQLSTLVNGNPDLLTAGSQMIGLLAAATQDNGDGKQLEKGTWVARNATQYNRGLHQQEAMALEKTRNENPDRALRFDAAACALVHCSASLPTSDERYPELKALETAGAAFTRELNELKATGRFEYGYLDSVDDFAARQDEFVTRSGAAISTGVNTFIGGSSALGAAAASPACLTGIGCLAPIGLTGLSALSFANAWDSAGTITAPYVSTEGERVISSFNPSNATPENSALSAAGTAAAMSVGEMLLLRGTGKLLLGEYGVGAKAGEKVYAYDGIVGAKATGQTLREVEVSSGGKGAWSKDLNKPEPNTIYKVDGNKTYQTDSMGRVERVESDLSYAKNDRNTYQQCVAGKCGVSGDEGGHLIASVFNGPGEKLNLLPMNGNLNKGAWKSMENTWANALKDGKPVNVKIEPIYSGSSVRPDRFNVKYSIDGGRPVNVDFKNAPGGGG